MPRTIGKIFSCSVMLAFVHDVFSAMINIYMNFELNNILCFLLSPIVDDLLLFSPILHLPLRNVSDPTTTGAIWRY
jgi:hypothetical protein